MLRLPLIEYVLRLLPEAFALILAMKIFSGSEIGTRRFLIAGAGLGTTVFLIRLLPISFGVHTFILLALYIALAHYYLKISMGKSIVSALSAIVLLSACDLINVFALIQVAGLPMEEILKENSMNRILYGLPSLILFVGVLFFYGKWRKGRTVAKDGI